VASGFRRKIDPHQRIFRLKAEATNEARRLMTRLTWMNGRLVEEKDAVVPFVTAGLHYGMGVFEGIRCYDTSSGPAVFRLRDHLDRLIASARILGFLDLPYDLDALAAAAKETIVANELGACYIRPLIYLAEGGMNLSIDAGRPHVGIAVWPWDSYHGERTQEDGIRVNVSSYTRHHPNVMPTRAKAAGNYVNSFLARTESARLGFDDAIMLDPAGYVAECTGENIFVVRRGRVFTPPLAAVLEGITRDSVIALARDVGLEVVEEAIVRDRLYDADEVFLCGTAAEIVGAREIDFRQIGNGRVGPVTRRLQEVFRSVVRGQHARSDQWLDYVDGQRVRRDLRIV
jgi:branched-chain amino acid aminotransferase